MQTSAAHPETLPFTEKISRVCRGGVGVFTIQLCCVFLRLNEHSVLEPACVSFGASVCTSVLLTFQLFVAYEYGIFGHLYGTIFFFKQIFV